MHAALFEQANLQYYIGSLYKHCFWNCIFIYTRCAVKSLSVCIACAPWIEYCALWVEI